MKREYKTGCFIEVYHLWWRAYLNRLRHIDLNHLELTCLLIKAGKNMVKNRTIIFSAILSIFMIFGFQQSAHAGMVGTQVIKSEVLLQTDLQQARRDIQKQLVELGVEQKLAQIRVANMSDNQISEITQQINELPAGASAGGVIVAIFVVLVITDIVGVTDIFPFIHPAR